MISLTNPDLYYSIFYDLREVYAFNHLDLYLAKLLLENENSENKYIFFFLMFLSMKTRGGDVCVDIENNVDLLEYMKTMSLLPEYFEKELLNSDFAGGIESNKPVIVDKNLVYLNRYYNYEKFFSSWVLKRSDMKYQDKNQLLEKLKRILPKYFSEDMSGPDWQKFSAISACFSNFSVVSGGPGTGKTTTIVKILAILQELNSPDFLKVGLCAPTGKAASRLVEALKPVRLNLGLKKEIIDSIPDKAYTIHRLLGLMPGTGEFRYNNDNKLQYDLIVVDEASMVDLRLMTSLCSALSDSCRLILLGDRFQLASVSPGSVLGDICGRGEELNYSNRFASVLKHFYDEKFIGSISSDRESSFSDSVTELKKSYRFSDNSGIGQLADSIKRGDSKSCLKILKSDKGDVEFVKVPGHMALESLVRLYARGYYSRILKSESPFAAFKFFSEFIILTALREGFFGFKNINRIVENEVLKETGYEERDSWFHGKPVMISKNDYQNNLFNGDIGICLNDKENADRLKVFFQNSERDFRGIYPVRLSNVDPVFAMTVHKSQGSEFDKVLIILPDNYSNILTRELIYTGVTRARKKVVIAGTEDVLKASLGRSVKRSSGLYGKLWS